jgi:glucose-1-phosphate thymidylyltransferase
MKGIILAGGSGTRLYPVTKAVSKQLLPIYDKPMIYYPLSVLMLAGIRDILIITTAHDQAQFKRLLGDGSGFGVTLTYEIQPEPNGIAEAFIIGGPFIGDDTACLILGDNLFYGHGFMQTLQDTVQTIEQDGGSVIFGYAVKDPERFGVVEFDENMKVLSLEEKPEKPKSEYAATGLYFYDNKVVDLAKQVTPSERGELEITSLNNAYLENGELSVRLLGRGFAWLDSGTHESLLQASQFIGAVEQRQDVKVACLEEIALTHGWMDKDQIRAKLDKTSKGSYYEYLVRLVSSAD